MMTHSTTYNHTARHGALRCAVLLAISILTSLILPTQATAEIVIGGNVYGGGNVGDLKKSETAEGSTKVVLKAGSIKGSVYGGARMADVEGHTYVNIDGAGQTGKLLVNAVYGGNDIAGTIGTVGTSELTVGTSEQPFKPKAPSLEKSSLNAVLYATPNTQYPMIIGSLYGGGNGAYDYDYDDEKGTYTVKQRDNAHTVIATVSNRPELDRTYIELGGGIYSHVFGGGNEATVTASTTIYADNATALNDNLHYISEEDASDVAFDEEHHEHRNGAVYFDFHVGCLFGGNNVESMDIRPTWHLKKMTVNNIYSGGNRGEMRHPSGIILPIQSDDLSANNVYGGCRIADVNPGANGDPDLKEEELYGHKFQAGYATRVYITAGRVNNVYGGNDIAGTVYHGSNVDIHGGLIGNVYGGGNGSYAYTDNEAWVAKHPEDADLLYSIGDYDSSVEALYHHRPHVESTLVHISGSEEKRVVVTGDVYCGGNSATLAKEGNQAEAKSTFKIGKHVIINGVFLGSNGVNMVTPGMLAKYQAVDAGTKYSNIDLTDENQMERYMDGVAVNIKPQLQWEENLEQQTFIGSLIFGGNKGSMTYEGMANITVPRDVVIYEKVVGGCNDANVRESAYNAAYEGGVTGSGTGTVGKQTNVKVNLTVNAYLIPKTLVNRDGKFVLDWDLTDIIGYETYDNQLKASRTFQKANIYGGCFNSGIINGGTVINISKPLIHPDVFDANIVVDGETFKAKDILLATGEDVYGSALAVYGAGFGANSEVRGNTLINFTGEASVLLAFGGGEQGVVTGSTEVYFDPDMLFPADPDYSIAPKINVYKAYGAGYAGPVKGNSTLNLHAGGVLRAFAGACNANIEGYTTAIVGYRDEEGDQYNYGKPYVANAVFGGNDFGGQIKGETKRDIKVTLPDGSFKTMQVLSQTYLQYLSGTIEKAVYGGSYGSYDYNERGVYSRGDPNGSPAFTTEIKSDDVDVIATNTFVHIDSKSRDTKDVIGYAAFVDRTAITGVMGGGRGYANLPGYVTVNQTYVLINGTDYTQRTDEAPMAYRVYGGGNLSLVHNTRIDAYSGTVERIFGGTHGVKTVSTKDNVAYNVGNTLINYYEGMKYDLTNVFGAGANSGTDKAVINLYGGRVYDVHGGAFTEGYTLATEINVPAGSTIQAHAIFGGGMGEEERRPCDVGISEINYESADASVELGLFGGNNNARATAETRITLNVPLRNKVGNLQTVYGGGYGAATVAGFTRIDLKDGAQVAHVYGGGKEGKVYNHYNYYQPSVDDKDSEAYAIADYYSKAPHRHANWINGKIQPDATAPKILDDDTKNTHIIIHKGAVVEKTAFGGGEGITAYVAGETRVDLLGGLVKQDIYGGGDAGDMPRMKAGVLGYIAGEKQTIGTECRILGGQVRKVFGGGLNGGIEGNTHVIIGVVEPLPSEEFTNVFPEDEVDAGSSLAPQLRDHNGLTFYYGIPAVQRNVYGGSERATVSGTSTVDMYNGYIGYEYAGIGKAATPIGDYHPVLDLDDDLAVREFEDEGNVYGAGYGEGAIAINTWVNLYGGTVRNSVYGGGEIAAVGEGSVTALGRSKATITTPGSAQVRIYGGLVMGDVFGGGRGYTYTHTYTGEDSPYKTTRLYTDGYVFGKTDVEIYRGTIGTAETLLEGRGNVFGGGNIGYVYSAGVKYTDATDKATAKINGHYYTDNSYSERSEDCRVHISVRCLALEDVQIGDKTFEKGSYVPTEYLDLLPHNDARWESLDDEGVTIYNAVFAGGNVSSGSDVVYANAVTVYGNATAAVVDAFDKDLINIGGEHIGGLYGDGNLTFVDGYRELNLTNYGTSHDYLASTIDEATYSDLSARDKAFYELNKDAVNDQIYRRLDGRMINTLQRADFCGIFGSRVLLHGAQDRVPDKVDYTNYAINRVGEISLNREIVGGTIHGTYFGIYNVANFLGAFTSDVMFDENHSDATSYYEYKETNLGNDLRNRGEALHTVAQASGVYLELVKELDANGNKVYGPITGVLELDLINAATGEGGGYVYAKKEYGKRSEVKPELAKQFVLSDANQEAITQSAFTYNQSEIQPMQTSGNFIHSEKHIVDDMFSEGVHYWYIRGDYYLHTLVVSAYAGSAQTFVNSITVPLPFSEKSNGEMQMLSVQPNWYTYYKTYNSQNDYQVLKLGESIQIDGKEYQLNDPISDWEYSQLTTQEKKHFVPVTYVAITDAILNGMSYKTGQVLLPNAYQNLLTLDAKTEEVFRISNEMSKDAGYVLNHVMSNPLDWDKTPPTFLCNKGGVYGQQSYTEEDLIGKAIYEEHQRVADKYTDAAIFEAAYIATEDVTFTTVDATTRTVFAGSYIDATIFGKINPDDTAKGKFERAYYCANTIEVEDKVFILNGELISATRYEELAALDFDVEDYFSEAYVCTQSGLYGGKEFEKGVNCDALKYVSLPSDQRVNFTYNYDALDLFSTDFSEDLTLYHEPFYENLDVNFSATYTGKNKKLAKLDATGTGYVGYDITNGTVLNRAEFELILNEQSHYEPVNVKTPGTYHIASEEFEYANVIYYIGKVVPNDVYEDLSTDHKAKCEAKTFGTEGTYYYCAEVYRSADGKQSVSKGTIKTQDEYNALKNDQKDFVIENVPTLATAKLYVPRESDIYNLSKDRVVSVAYKYRYNEPKADGTHDVRVERHIVNVNIQFRNGQPTIGTLAEPGTVLPNSVIGLSVPAVIPGAYEVIGSGWEIYKSQADAESHQNGAVYKNNATRMYWYQNGYYVAYYTKTYLGRTYSNAVPLNIANYHRLGEVMNHKVDDVNEYMYIDHEDVKEPSKIYLDDEEYASTSIAAGSEKNDLDYLYDLYKATTDGRLDQTKVGNCHFMDFILRSNIAPKMYADWNSIGDKDKCFSGNFHGNGYTISGLDESLFGYLCGEVYNLGVTGSFIGGGVADNGGDPSGGYAENCWVYTSGNPEGSKAVIGDGGSVVNSYYRADNGFTVTGGNGTAKSQAEFDMGEVAYLLNAFYLDKRFRANNTDASDDNLMKYVEIYFANGDFRYADGSVPTEMDVRYDAEKHTYVPIYPDDYIFFGQQLTYVPDPVLAQEMNTEVHESLPGRIDKTLVDGVERIVISNSNRVYRAPAYKQSMRIDKVYFNTFAYFANNCNGQPIHSNLTAIDFTGDNDFVYKGTEGDYRPYLDYEGLEHVNFTDLTSNLLIYADPINDAASYAVLKDLYVPVLIFGKKVGEEYVNKYNELGKQDNIGNVHGHLVDLVVDGSGNRSYVARRHHFLVDKEDFNAPIAYTFDNGYYMWHQRTPAHYTEGEGKGWESLCLPFEADMTTTQDKGQITHFYEGSTAYHEYWLRELESVTTGTETSALFRCPDAGTQSLVVKNTFLYDYYYSYNDDKDDNGDNYQDYYQQEYRTYPKYPNIEAYKPYIMAFPGVRYYEFDMSGLFVPEHTGDDIAKLAPQVVTFVSVNNAKIAITDVALAEQKAKVGDYSYTGALINEPIGSNYVLDGKGEKFTYSGALVPFRAYMSASSDAAPRHILIGNAGQEEEPTEEILQRGLKIWGKGEAIYIESTLEYEAVVTIHSLSGQIVNRVTVKPMSKEVVPVSSRGVYIVNNKKVAVL
ncbi:MAG: hypothetical protein IKY72_01915 [Bacteroidaceae bacterium]|nr:hypothetical protein [Bacteroidaceae bacterium]